MRPNAVKPKAVPEFRHNDDDLEAEVEPGLSDDDNDSEYASDVSHSAQKRKPPAKKTDKPEQKEGVVKKTVRKISATAHANYQRLKIKGKGGNGGKGRGKFGRRK